MRITNALRTTFGDVVAFLGGLRATVPHDTIETSDPLETQFEKLPLVKRGYTSDNEGNLLRIEVRGHKDRFGEGQLFRRVSRVGGVLLRNPTT